MEESFLFSEIKELLEESVYRYNCQEFISLDPISIPHQFEQKADIEISGFLAATIAWGNRTMIVRNANRLIQLMEFEPYRFVMEASDSEMECVGTFVHRTFNGSDLLFMLRSLRNIYKRHGGMETVFERGFYRGNSVYSALAYFRSIFFETEHLTHCEKHISSVEKGASAKRLNMYLRWMVRNDGRGVDFGLWNGIPASALMLPLDVHTGEVSRKLGILRRKQNDWKAVEEVTSVLREMDASDPVKYDFALFGLGIDKKI